MGIETRIGIVLGLIIVVIASIYFFYGNNSEKDQFVVATGSKVGDKGKPTEPPKIPPSADRSRPARAAPSARPPTVANKTPSGTSVRSGSPLDKPPAPADPSVATGPRPSSPIEQGPPSPSEPRHAEGSTPRLAKLDGPGRETGVDAVGGARTPVISTSDEPKVTPLRTGPSQGLVEATKENIEKAQNPPTTTSPSSSSALAKASEPPKQTPALTADPLRLGRPMTAGPSHPSSPTVSPPPQPRQHKIISGDTVALISETYFGNAGHVSEILAANPQIKDPRRLKIGEVLVIPVVGDSASASAKTPVKSAAGGATVSASKTYEVKEGDTLYGIAKSLYGDGTRWHEIYELNKAAMKNDPKRLKVGMVLNVPE